MPCVRCSRCGARRTLPKHPDEYLRMPQCKTPGCALRTKRSGGRQAYRVDRWRHQHEVGPNAPRPCRCGGFYGFPHRRGSKWCAHNPNWTEADAYEVFGAPTPWWRDDPLCFGRQPTTSDDPPF